MSSVPGTKVQKMAASEFNKCTGVSLPLDLNTALTFNAEADDFIKSQSAFATYYAGYGWFGQLASLVPFNAYLLNVG